MVEIKAGEKYVCANGDVVGPIEDNEHDRFPWRNPTGAHPKQRYINWNKDGSIATLDGFVHNVDPSYAIVSRFSASPIREITRKEIVPGRYGVLSIGGKYDMPDCDDPSKASTIGIHVTLMSNTLSADELDAAASVLTQIAAVLRENQ